MDVTPITAASQGATANVRNVTVTNQLFQSTQEGLKAHAGGGQPLATPINSMCARFTTIATTLDSAILPASIPGLEITVINATPVGNATKPEHLSRSRRLDQTRCGQCAICVGGHQNGDLLLHRCRNLALDSVRVMRGNKCSI